MDTQSKYRKRYEKIMIDFEKAKAEDKKENEKLIKLLNDSRYRREKINIHESFGDKVSDMIAKFGGSWKFIISFFVFLIIWVTINVLHLLGLDFDPYPFILLNLALSMIAAFQAPIIMMSQNRQAKKDKLDEVNDAKVNKQSNAKLNLAMRRMENLHHEMGQIQKLLQLDIDMKFEQKDGGR